VAKKDKHYFEALHASAVIRRKLEKNIRLSIEREVW
jgi:hypothetical protein